MVVDPKDAKKKEDEYFKRQESELLGRLRKEQLAKEEIDKLKQLQELHFMHCPKCGLDLVEKSFDEVTVDVCSNCDGIWLDKGELDLLKKKEGFKIQDIFKIFS